MSFWPDGYVPDAVDIIQGVSKELVNKNYENAIAFLEEAWERLPGDKLSTSESFHIVEYMLKVSIQIGDKERMNSWVDKIFTADPDRLDSYRRNLFVGKVAYENGDFVKAKEYLTIANKESEGRCFGKFDGKYLRFLKKGV